jgi:hypothetical protein
MDEDNIDDILIDEAPFREGYIPRPPPLPQSSSSISVRPDEELRITDESLNLKNEIATDAIINPPPIPSRDNKPQLTPPPIPSRDTKPQLTPPPVPSRDTKPQLTPPVKPIPPKPPAITPQTQYPYAYMSSPYFGMNPMQMMQGVTGTFDNNTHHMKWIVVVFVIILILMVIAVFVLYSSTEFIPSRVAHYDSLGPASFLLSIGSSMPWTPLAYSSFSSTEHLQLAPSGSSGSNLDGGLSADLGMIMTSGSCEFNPDVNSIKKKKNKFIDFSQVRKDIQ